MAMDYTRFLSAIQRKALTIKHVEGPQGVRGRCSDNRLIYEKLGWAPEQPLYQNLAVTYSWIREQINKATLL